MNMLEATCRLGDIMPSGAAVAATPLNLSRAKKGVIQFQPLRRIRG